MTKDTELDFELVDDLDGDQETDDETNESGNDSSEDKDVTDKEASKKPSNKSNWKKMAKKVRALEEENAKLKASKKDEDSSDEEDFDDLDDLDDWDSYDEQDLRLFIIENNAQEFKSEINSLLEKYPNMEFEDALKFAKANKPKESESSKDFNVKSKNLKVKKTLNDLTEDEALKLDNATYLKWARAKWVVK